MRTLINNILDDLKSIDNIKKDIAHFYLGIPDQISNKELDAGALFIRPSQNTSAPVTTGIKELNNIDLTIIVAKQTKNKNYRNAKETADAWMIRVIEDTDENNNLKTNTIKYKLREKLRKRGKKQDAMTITYDSNEFINAGVVSATINLSVVDIYNITVT